MSPERGAFLLRDALMLILALLCGAAAAAELCAECECVGDSALCGPGVRADLFSTPAALLAAPDVRHLRVRGAPGLALPWTTFAVPPADGRRHSALSSLSVSMNALGCARENAWLSRVSSLQNSFPFRRLEQEARCSDKLCRVSGAQLSRLPPTLTVTGNSPCDWAAEGDVRLDVATTGGDVDVSCSVSGGGCVRLRYAPLRGSIAIAPPKTCKVSVEFHMRGLSPNDTGFFICAQESPKLPPKIVAEPLRIKGAPRLMRQKVSHLSEDQLDTLELAAFPAIRKEDIRWFFYTEQYQIHENETHRKYRTGYEKWEFFPELVEEVMIIDLHSNISTANTLSTLSVKFIKPKLSCHTGTYESNICNSEGCYVATIHVYPDQTIHECTKHMNIQQLFNVNDSFVQELNHRSDFELIEQELVQDDESVATTVKPMIPKPEQRSDISIVLITLLSLFVMAMLTLIGLRCYASARPSRLGRNGPRAKFVREGDEFRSRLIFRPTSLFNNVNYVSWIDSIKREKKIPVIPFGSLDIVCLLGEGAFGEVFLVRESGGGEWALKQLKLSSGSQMREMEREASTLLALHHPNIVAFHGVTFKSDNFGLLFEFMAGGDLVAFLRARNPDLADGVDPLPFHDLIRMCSDVAGGLAYLASLGLVHRDLAARNCLVATIQDRIFVKISDFGMSREICGTSYYKMGSDTLVPVRWLPPESISYRKFTVESDVWSFGVCLWEIFSSGQIPWSEFSNSEAEDLIKKLILEEEEARRSPTDDFFDVAPETETTPLRTNETDSISSSEGQTVVAESISAALSQDGHL